MSSDKQLHIPDNLKHILINELNLSKRVLNPLLRQGISTLGQVGGLDYSELRKVPRVGEKQAQEIIEAVINYCESNPNEKEDEQPLLRIGSEERPNLVHLIVPLTKAVTEAYNDQRGFKFIKYYHGLGGGKSYTLQEIGDAEDLTRERIRQINLKTCNRVSAALFGQKGITNRLVSDNLVREAIELKRMLSSADIIRLEDDIIKEVENRYNQNLYSKELNDLKYLLVLFGFKELTQKPPGYNGSRIKAWKVEDSIDINKVFEAMILVYKVLQSNILPLSIFELKMEINRRRKNKLDENSIQHAMKVCPDVELTSEGRYQLKIEHLASVADQAYRILWENGEPLHFRKIVREINHRLVSAGVPASAYSRSLTGQMVTDARFESIGRSGKWKLSEWDHVYTQTTVEIMTEFLHLKREPATIDEIHSYVIQKRPDIPKNSIATYLYEKNAFVRVFTSHYALAEWGVEPAPQRKIGPSWSARLLPEIQDIFSSLPSKEMPLSELVSELEKRTKLPSTNIYSWIKRTGIPATIPNPTNRNHKIAVLKDEALQAQIRPKTLMQIVQEEIENYLLKQPGKRTKVSEIREHVMKVTGCKRQTFYRYLSSMEQVKKEKIINISYCYLSDDPVLRSKSLDFLQLSDIHEEPLKSNIIRAIELLNVDNVDIGLFQIGKIFETELKSFLLAAKNKGIFTVSNNDLARLVNMIDCVVREGVIQKKHELTYLREERNERAHGAIPQKSEREKLMRYAPFLGGLYIDYILFFHNERLRINSS